MLGSMLFIAVLSAVAMVIQAGDQVKDNCVMSFTDFNANAPGKDWITLYAFEDMQVGDRLKEHTTYTIDGDSLEVLKYEWKEPDRSCLYRTFNGNRTQLGIDNDLAEIQGPGGEVVRFVSTQPDEYIMENICVDGPTCDVSLNFIKVLDQRTDATCLTTGSDDIDLTQIPWHDIVDDLSKCYKRKFKDDKSPTVEWVWKGRTECPPPLAT